MGLESCFMGIEHGSEEQVNIHHARLLTVGGFVAAVYGPGKGDGSFGLKYAGPYLALGPFLWSLGPRSLGPLAP